MRPDGNDGRSGIRATIDGFGTLGLVSVIFSLRSGETPAAKTQDELRQETHRHPRRLWLRRSA